MKACVILLCALAVFAAVEACHHQEDNDDVEVQKSAIVHHRHRENVEIEVEDQKKENHHEELHHHHMHHHHHGHADRHLKMVADFVRHTMNESGLNKESQHQLCEILKRQKPDFPKKPWMKLTEEERKAFQKQISNKWNAFKSEAYRAIDESEKEHLDRFVKTMEEQYINHIASGKHEDAVFAWKLKQMTKGAGLSDSATKHIFAVLNDHKPNKTSIEKFKHLTRKQRSEAVKKYWNSIKEDCRTRVEISEHPALDKFFADIERKYREANKSNHGIKDHHGHRRSHHRHQVHDDEEVKMSRRRHDDDSDDEDRHRHHRRDHDGDDDDSHRRHHRHHHDRDEEYDDEDSHRYHRRHHDDDDDSHLRHHRRHHRHRDDDSVDHDREDRRGNRHHRRHHNEDE